MKNVSKKFLWMYLGVALLAAGTVFADSTDTIRATIPFAFMVGNEPHSAGDYSIRQAGLLDALVLRAADDRLAHVFLTNSARGTRPQDETKLVFSRYGNRYFLKEIWVVGELSGHQIPRTAAEKEAAMVSNRVLPDEVIVLAAR